MKRRTDRRVVILFLGTIALAALAVIGYLAAREIPIPDVLIAGFSGAIGSLGTLLTQQRARRRRRRRKASPQPA